MDLDNILWLMDLNLKDNGLMMKEKEEEYFYMLQEINMKEIIQKM